MNSTKQQSCTWLARKYLLFSFGIYATLAGIMGVTLLGMKMGLPSGVSMFIAFCGVIFARTFYEQLVIYDVPKNNITPKKNAIFAGLYAVIMSLLFHFIRGPFGYWGIPVVFILAQNAIKPIRAYLWPSTQRTGLYEVYETKLKAYTASLYGFYGLLALITVTGIKVLHSSFMCSFGVAVLIALLITGMFELLFLYEQQINRKIIFWWLIMALCLSIIATVVVMALIKFCGLPGKMATILACVTVKIIEQYIVSHWMCLTGTCTLCQKS